MQNLEMIAPAELTVDTNVRTQVNLTAEFVDSIREHGVLEPVVAHRTENGLKVVMGQRRTLASVEAELATIPVFIVDSPEEADRIAQQVVENDMRAGLKSVERAQAYQQLSLLGISPEKIAKRTGTTAEIVKDAITAHGNESGQQAMEQGLPFDMAAQIAEFEAYPDAVAELTEYALDYPEHFPHQLQRARRQMAMDIAVEEKKAQLDEAGHNVVEDGIPPQRLNRPDGTLADSEDANALMVKFFYGHDEPHVESVITNWEESGYTIRNSSSTDQGSGRMNEEQKAQRKLLIQRNKEMDDATLVRIDFLLALLQRKDLPKGYEQFAATAMVAHRHELIRADMHLVCKILGMPTDGSYHSSKIAQEANKSAKRANQLMLATALATYEKQMVRDCWRDANSYGSDLRVNYLEQLQTWGYTLSSVERIAARIDEK